MSKITDRIQTSKVSISSFRTGPLNHQLLPASQIDWVPPYLTPLLLPLGLKSAQMICSLIYLLICSFTQEIQEPLMWEAFCQVQMNRTGLTLTYSVEGKRKHESSYQHIMRKKVNAFAKKKKKSQKSNGNLTLYSENSFAHEINID